MPRPLRHVRTDQRGITLVELLVSIALGLVVLTAGVAIFTTVIRGQPKIADRASSVQTARTFMEQLTREIRQGSTVQTATASQLKLLTYIDRTACGTGTVSTAAIQCQVTYTCASGICTRTERNPDGSGTAAAVRMVEGLSSNNIFSYSPSTTAPTFVGIDLVFPGTDTTDDAITLSDGVELRNAPS